MWELFSQIIANNIYGMEEVLIVLIVIKTLLTFHYLFGFCTINPMRLYNVETYYKDVVEPVI